MEFFLSFRVCLVTLFHKYVWVLIFSQNILISSYYFECLNVPDKYRGFSFVCMFISKTGHFNLAIVCWSYCFARVKLIDKSILYEPTSFLKTFIEIWFCYHPSAQSRAMSSMTVLYLKNKDKMYQNSLN